MSESRVGISPPKAPSGSFWLGFILSVVLTGAWQFAVGIAVVLMASSRLLAMHTRYQDEAAGVLWLTGVALNSWGLYRATRVVRPRTVNGVFIGIGLIILITMLLIWLVVMMKDYSAGDE
jgi:hypothetical protein